jgi:hypothetical protein
MLPPPITAPVTASLATPTEDVVGLRWRPLICRSSLERAYEFSCRVRAGEVARPKVLGVLSAPWMEFGAWRGEDLPNQGGPETTVTAAQQRVTFSAEVRFPSWQTLIEL